MRAIVLAGGMGSRLTQPVMPKALVQVGGRTMLEWALIEIGSMETSVLVNAAQREAFVPLAQRRDFELIDVVDPSPTAALAGVVRSEESVVVLHADEICDAPGSARLFVATMQRSQGAVVGRAAGLRTDRLFAAVCRSDRVRIRDDGRISDDDADRCTGASVPHAEPRGRFIGRYAFSVTSEMERSLRATTSVLAAVLQAEPRFIVLDVPKTYVDCGTDALLRRAEGLLRS